MTINPFSWNVLSLLPPFNKKRSTWNLKNNNPVRPIYTLTGMITIFQIVQLFSNHNDIEYPEEIEFMKKKQSFLIQNLNFLNYNSVALSQWLKLDHFTDAFVS